MILSMVTTPLVHIFSFRSAKTITQTFKHCLTGD